MLGTFYRLARVAVGAMAFAVWWYYMGAILAAEADEVEFTFGAPVKDGEHTYACIEKTHADEAGKRDYDASDDRR
jgi:hypothetical protein